MLIVSLPFSVLGLLLKEVGFGFTFFDNIFADGVRLAGHRALINGNLAGVDEVAVCGDFHTLTELYNIANHKFVLMEFDGLSVSDDSDFFATVCDFVQLHKLPFFLVVVDCCHQRADDDRHHDCESFNPGQVAIFGCCGPN